MRGAPQLGFSATISKIRSRTSFEVGLLPTGFLTFEIILQYQRNPARCHRTTVSGVTTRRACFQPDQHRRTTNQKSLSDESSFVIDSTVGRSFGEEQGIRCCWRIGLRDVGATPVVDRILGCDLRRFRKSRGCRGALRGTDRPCTSAIRVTCATCPRGCSSSEEERGNSPRLRCLRNPRSRLPDALLATPRL